MKQKILTTTGIITICILGILLSCISTSKHFNANGLSYEGYANDGTTMIVMFKDRAKQVIAFDKELRVVELWRMKCNIIKWNWYGFWFYIKPNNNPSLTDSRYGENPISTLLRLRLRGMHDTPTTIYETIEAGCGMPNSYYYGMKNGEDLTEDAIFKKDGRLILDDSKLRPTQMDTETFSELWDGLERVLMQNKASEIIGRKLPYPLDSDTKL